MRIRHYFRFALPAVPAGLIESHAAWCCAIDRKIKINTQDEQALIIIQALHLSRAEPRPGLGQMGLLLGDNWLLSFRERPDPLINRILARLDRPSSRLRSNPAA